MEKCKKEDSDVTNTASCHNKDISKSCKPIKIQYFTFGKDNCLVHHPTTQSKKNSPSALFYKTNPFNTQSQAKKTCHKKLKSTLRAPYKKEKFTSQADAIKQEAISKITRHLKQPHASSVSDPLSIVIRGTSLKLEPKKQFKISTCCTTGYCPSIKRCKMCGEIMMNIPSSMSSLTKAYSSSSSCSACIDKRTSSIVCKDKAENIAHKHNPIIKRCIICSKLFKQPSSSVVCEKCPPVVRTEEHERGPVPTTKGRRFLSKTNSEKIVKNAMSSRLREDYIDRFNKYKAVQSSKSNKLPSKSKDTVEDVLQVRSLSSKQQLKTKVNVSDKNVSTENSFKPMQTKLVEANRLTTKAKSTAATSKSYVYSEQCKNSNVACGKTNVSNMPTYIKSSRRNLDTKCQSVAQQTIPEINIGTEHSEHINTTNKKPSIEKLNMSAHTKSIPSSSQLTTSRKDDASEHPLNSNFPSEQHKNSNLGYEAAVANRFSRSVQTNSLSETNLDITISDNSSEGYTSEGFFNREQVKKSNTDQRKSSTEELNTVVQTRTISDPSQQTSKNDPEGYLKNQSKNIYQTNKDDSAQTPIHTKSLQLDQDFLSKISTDLVLQHNEDKKSKDKNISPIPVLQNVTVNNYYYLTGCDLKEKFPNGPVSCTNDSSVTTKHSSSGSFSVSSDNEDSLEIDKIQDKQNESSFDNQASYGHLKSFPLQLKFPKSVFQELGGVFKYNTDDFFSNTFESHHEISFLKDACSALENDPCPKISRTCDLSSNLYQIGIPEITLQNLSLCTEKEFQNYNQDVQSLCDIKHLNPYIQKSLMIFEEMDNVRNEPIDPEKILQELKENPQLMKSINQMAAKKLNFSRKATVFKDPRFK